MRSITLAATLALLIAHPGPQANGGASAAERARLEKGFRSYLREPHEKARDDVWRAVGKLAEKLTIDEVEDLVRAAVPGEHWSDGYTDAVEFESAGETWSYSLILPMRKREGLIPLVVDIGHGSWKNADAKQREEGMRTWLRTAGANERVAYLRTRVIDKLTLDGRYDAWTVPPRRPADQPNLDTLGSVLLDAVRAACLRYPIDPDRVYVQGISQTGYWTWWLAQMAPDRWAAAAPVASVTMHVRQLVPNVRTVPLYVLHGTADPTCPFAQAKGMVDDVKEAGGDVDFRPSEGGGHMEGVFVRFSEIWPEMAKRTRDPYPKRCERKITSAARPDAHWLRAEGITSQEFNPWGAPCRLVGSIEGQAINVEARGCKQVTVFISSKMVEAGRTVTIQLNGKPAWSGRLKPDPRGALDLARSRGDAAAFGASVTLDV